MLIAAEAFACRIWPKGEPLTREIVDEILSWEFPVAVHAQIRELREKNSEGEITSQELELLDRYRRQGKKSTS